MLVRMWGTGEHSFIVGGSASLYRNHSRNQCGRSSGRWDSALQSPAVQLLSMCRKTLLPTISTVIAALFIMIRNWKQSICLSVDEWIIKPGYSYTMRSHLAVKKNKTMKFAGKWMESHKIILSEVTQTPKDKYCVLFLLSRG